MIPAAILEMPEEWQWDLSKLLDRRTKDEAKTLCHALESYLRESPGQMTLPNLRDLLGPYGIYLDA